MLNAAHLRGLLREGFRFVSLPREGQAACRVEVEAEGLGRSYVQRVTTAGSVGDGCNALISESKRKTTLRYEGRSRLASTCMWSNSLLVLSHLPPSPRLEEPPGGRREPERRRPKAHRMSVATTGPRREQACQPERSGGDPEGAGAPAQRLGPQRSPRAASKEDGPGPSRGGETGRAEHPRALSARQPPAGSREPRGHRCSDDDAEAPSWGGRAAGGRGGLKW